MVGINPFYYYLIIEILIVCMVLLPLFMGFNFEYSLLITIYEKGIVIDGIAYYEWGEVNKINNGDLTVLKIKNIPKEIIVQQQL